MSDGEEMTGSVREEAGVRTKVLSLADGDERALLIALPENDGLCPGDSCLWPGERKPPPWSEVSPAVQGIG